MYVPGRTDDPFWGTVCVQPVACRIPLLQEKLQTTGKLHCALRPESEFLHGFSTKKSALQISIVDFKLQTNMVNSIHVSVILMLAVILLLKIC